jgi:hypothetical protein
MRTAAQLRDEASRMQEFARFITDQVVLEEIKSMIAEWEQRARLLDEGEKPSI